MVLSFVNTFPGADDVGKIDCQHGNDKKITINVFVVLSFFSSMLVSSETEHCTVGALTELDGELDTLDTLDTRSRDTEEVHMDVAFPSTFKPKL